MSSYTSENPSDTILPLKEIPGSYGLPFLGPIQDREVAYKEIIPTFEISVSRLFTDLEAELSDKGEANFNAISDKMSFDLLFLLFANTSSYDTECCRRCSAKLCRNRWIGFAPAASWGAIVAEEGGVTLAGINKMSLAKSVVWEALRIEPPVTSQYGKAKDDITITSHDASYIIKKGEVIFGYQPIATKDPKIFVNPEEFVPDRFVGDGEKLIKYVYWSNGRETDDPTTKNKQCPGKDMVVLLSRLMLVEFFRRYDTFNVEVGMLLLGSSVTFKSLTKTEI
ncbi:allene oxide synthase-like [Dorcoceras hygrometricum]|uniref:Allene oxide synthase-like n=1 Tax=Dorcoceras hygrometricum TaxID=472368 RepID=A0A2Z7D0A1_9LAMI|nr:allene oxide synthase-like [Dorcoceras hygrometricum]